MTVVLFADSDEGIRVLVQHALTEAGFELVAAATAEETLRLLSTVNPDVLLLDQMLPASMKDAFVELIAETQRVPTVLMTTGLADGQADDLGAVVLRKPFDIEELLHALTSVLGDRRGAS